MPFRGTKAATIVRRDPVFVHGQGWQIVEEYIGGHEEIDGLLPGLAADGWNFTISKNRATSTLRATKQISPDNNENEFYDRFTITRETIQKSIWTLKSVQDEGAGFGDGFDKYRGHIETAVKEGSESTLEGELPVATYPQAWNAYRELVRGADSYEDEYIVVTRERLVGLQYGVPMDLRDGNASLIYSTNGLISTFSFPTLTGITYPVDPGDAPSGTVYGWRSRRQEIRFTEGSRAEIVQDWVWAAWSTFLYTFAI